MGNFYFLTKTRPKYFIRTSKRKCNTSKVILLNYSLDTVYVRGFSIEGLYLLLSLLNQVYHLVLFKGLSEWIHCNVIYFVQSHYTNISLVSLTTESCF